MSKRISFLLQDIDYSDEISQLQAILKGSGITVDMYRKVSNIGNYSVLTIDYEPEKLRARKTRNAGRHYIPTKGHFTCGNIRKLKKTMTNKQLAKELNISVRTLYRRLKENENNPDEELFM